MEKTPSPITQAGPGSIRADEAYTLPEFKARMKMQDDAIRKAKRCGLKLRKHGRSKFVMGDEALAFLRACPEA